MNALSQETINELIKLAKRTTWFESIEAEDSTIDDYSGSNVDDAYDGGCRDGATELARTILTELKVEW